MSKVELLLSEDRTEGKNLAKNMALKAEPELLKGKRLLTEQEIAILRENHNSSSDPQWRNIYVSEEFHPELIQNSEFQGIVVLGNLHFGYLKFHDLSLQIGIYHSLIISCVLGEDICIRNVAYLSNYRIGDRVMLFNLQEMSCTEHAKFGNGFLKEGESESDRIWIEVANENGGRAILPFEGMIPADAYLWAKYREDRDFMVRLQELTEYRADRRQNTFGRVENGAVVKNTVLIKDTKIGASAYIKGALKLKNITVCSSHEEPSQIGEGVEMVNGIMGYGSKVFYQAVAVRFVIGRNCQLKYGARLLNSVLGDNSTVSCCELLNNLIFPFHEQHHNTSFLIASTLLGQSNVAAGATIGSNHNSRSPDGEIVAGRGFWPGLCSDFKHNSKFASFSLVAKGTYPQELNVIYPFSLICSNPNDPAVHIIPAYWFQYNMFAMARNSYKFRQRDLRKVKTQYIETESLAPDTIQEILIALDRLIVLTAEWLMKQNGTGANLQEAKDYLHQTSNFSLVLEDPHCMKKHGAKILKPIRGYREYRKVMKYFALKTIVEYCGKENIHTLSYSVIEKIYRYELFTSWENLGGQVLPSAKVEELKDRVKSGKIVNWDAVHLFYEKCQEEYLQDKVRYALYLLEHLYSKKIMQFTEKDYQDMLADVLSVSKSIYRNSVASRKKDYLNEFRKITYRNPREMKVVVGELKENKFLKQLKRDTLEFNQKLLSVFSFIQK